MASQMAIFVQKDGKMVPVTVQSLIQESEARSGRIRAMRQRLEKFKQKRDALLGIGTKRTKNVGGRGRSSFDLEKMRRVCATMDKITGRIFAETQEAEEANSMMISQYQSKVEDLQSRDDRNDGSHAPPSKNTVTGQQKRNMRNGSTKSSGRKPGGQPGHKGANKDKKRHVDRVQKHVRTTCQCCNSENIRAIDKVTEYRTEVPPVPKSVTTKHLIMIYVCDDCLKGRCGCTPQENNGGKTTVASYNADADADEESVEDPDIKVETIVDDSTEKNPEGTCTGTVMAAKADIPRDGMYGVNALTEAVYNYNNRMPNRMNSDSMRRGGISMSNGTISHVMDRFGMYTTLPADEIMQLIRRCSILNVDETSIRYRGTTYWLWVFYDPLTGTAYYIISPSRGAGVPRDVLGQDWRGIIVCDGWTAYNGYKIQRCWAHIIRELETLHLKNPDSAEAAAALKTLRKILHDAKQIRDKSKRVRAQYKKNLEARVRRLIRKYADDPVIGGFMPKLGRALPNLFWFVLDPRIPPTNNFAEQHLRESVIVRQIRGCIRSENSLERTANLLTCITTWKNHGLDPFKEIKKYIPMI